MNIYNSIYIYIYTSFSCNGLEVPRTNNTHYLPLCELISGQAVTISNEGNNSDQPRNGRTTPALPSVIVAV